MYFSSFNIAFLTTCFLIPANLFAQAGDIQFRADTIRFTQDLENPISNRVLMLDSRMSGGEIGYYFHAVDPNQNGMLNFLQNQNIQKQIEFSPEQKKEFDALKKKFSEGLARLATQYSHRIDNKIAAELRNQFTLKYNEEIKKFREEIEKEVTETLVPQQVKLVKQLQFNQSVRIWGFAGTLSRKPYSDQIKTTKKQTQNLIKIKQEAEAEIKQAIEEIRAKAKAKMMKEFDRKQREKIKELEGESKKKNFPDKL